MKLDKFFSELKRQVFHFLEIPNWVVRLESGVGSRFTFDIPINFS